MPVTTRYKKGKKYKRDKFPIEHMLEKPAIDFRQKDFEPLLDELQANILKHHRKAIAEHHFIEFKDGPKGVDFLEELSEHITSAKAQLEGRSPIVLTVAITFAGYEKLGISNNLIPEGDAFSTPFKERVLLGNENVEADYDKPFDAIVLFAYDQLPKLEKGKTKTKGMFWEYMVQEHNTVSLSSFCKSIVYEEGLLHSPLKEAFRFKENISNPRFFPGAFSISRRKNMMQAIQSVKAADLPKLDLVLTQDKAGNTGFSCGSFGAFAKFEMNERAFEKMVTDLEIKAGLSEKEALAYLMGRFPDGTPLTLSKAPIQLPTDNFDYTELIKTRQIKSANEDSGSRCPFHAHIRKANPRTEGSSEKRIVRRGSFFKKENGESDVKGMLFMSFQNSLEQQFEHILNDWMLNKSFIKEGETEMFSTKSGRDMLFAKAGDVYPLPQTWNSKEQTKDRKTITIKEPFVSFNGGLYFFQPSISFFKRISLFGEIANAKKNHADKMEKRTTKGPVTGELKNFRKETIIAIGAKKVKKGKVKMLRGSQVILEG